MVLTVDVTWVFDFEDIPEAIKNYITIRAANVFAGRAVGSAEAVKFGQQEEVLARAGALEYETQQGDYNIFGNTRRRLYVQLLPSPRYCLSLLIMAAISQSVPTLLGGVSQQPDPIKLPGQVRKADNVYLDPTFGCVKRPPTKFVDQVRTISPPTPSGSLSLGITMSATLLAVITTKTLPLRLGSVCSKLIQASNALSPTQIMWVIIWTQVPSATSSS